MSHHSSGERAVPVRHSLRCQSGRSVVGRIAAGGPYHHCHSAERADGHWHGGADRAGHVHAGQIADGVNLRGAALCASGLAPCGVSWAAAGTVAGCQIASGARPRRHGDTGPSAATHHAPIWNPDHMAKTCTYMVYTCQRHPCPMAPMLGDRHVADMFVNLTICVDMYIPNPKITNMS